MAPECFNISNNVVSFHCDIYALGVLAITTIVHCFLLVVFAAAVALRWLLFKRTQRCMSQPSLDAPLTRNCYISSFSSWLCRHRHVGDADQTVSWCLQLVYLFICNAITIQAIYIIYIICVYSGSLVAPLYFSMC